MVGQKHVLILQCLVDQAGTFSFKIFIISRTLRESVSLHHLNLYEGLKWLQYNILDHLKCVQSDFVNSEVELI